MSRLCSRRQTTTTQAPTPLPDARKLANKQRRKAGRERHEERKTQLKALESDRRWARIERDAQRQGKRPDNGTRAFVGRNLDNQRAAISRLHASAAAAVVVEGCDAEEEEEEEEAAREAVHSGHEVVVPHVTSGAVLLAMARPAKVHGGRRHHPHMLGVTDGEAFEVVEVDGRFVALDEDGWEILPDENAEASLLYSDIVRGDVP